jgi:hypothetical protein
VNYFKLLSARRKSGRLPTMAQHHWSAEQRKLAEANRCIQCGGPNAATGSYLCTDCQGEWTMKDIREEIAALRQNMLKTT